MKAAAYLEVVAGAPRGTHALRDGLNTIGRALECDLVIAHASVSRRHARISWRGGLFLVEDLGSRHGVCVDGRRVAGPSRLMPGSRLHVGAVELRLHVVDPEASTGSLETAASDPQALGAWYGLTPAEARLARQLAAGRSLAEAAAELGVTLHTVRSTLKAVFQKTGARRQAELVRLVLLGPAGRE